MRPRLDGGTSAVLDLKDLGELHPRIRRVLQNVRRPRTKPEAERDRRLGGEGGRIVKLPSPNGGLRGAAICNVKGERSQTVEFYIPDVVHIRISLEHSPLKAKGFAARIEVEFKAKTLHAEDDQAAIVQRELNAVHWLFFGELPPDGFADEPARRVPRSHLHRLGWNIHHLELCADVLGLKWLRDDAVNFVVSRASMKPAVHGGHKKLAETVSLGKRYDSNVSFCGYDKLQEQADKSKNCEGYLAQWRANGYDENLHAELGIGRAEFRLHGERGLKWEKEETRRSPAGVDEVSVELFDLRDPLFAASRRAREETFRYLAQLHFRIVVPGSASERKNCKTDPRWTWVQRVVEGAAPRMRQRREAQENVHAAATERHARSALRNVQRFANLQGITPQSETDYGEAIVIALRHLQGRNADRALGRVQSFADAQIAGEARELAAEVPRGGDGKRLQLESLRSELKTKADAYNATPAGERESRRVRRRAFNETRMELIEYGENYRALRESFMGPEIEAARIRYLDERARLRGGLHVHTATGWASQGAAA